MENLLSLKEKLFEHCLEIIEQKIQLAQNALKSAHEGINQEGKSSMGDKYETSKAMLDLEKEKIQSQLSASLQLKRNLVQIKPQKIQNEVGFGSIVQTNQGIYFFGVGLGKIKFHQKDYFVISLVSPLGQALLGKKTGDQITFQKRVFQIEVIS